MALYTPFNVIGKYGVNGQIDSNHTLVMITKASAIALTLIDPPMELDGHEMTIVATTTASTHSVTYSGGFAAAGGGDDVISMTTKGDTATIVAIRGKWYVKALYGATIA